MRECLYHPVFLINFELGRYCNYACSYCWPAAHSAIRDHIPTEIVIEGLAEIRRQAAANGFTEFVYNISGGEPTLHPGYLDIIASLTDPAFHSIELVSNISRGQRWWERFIAASAHFQRVFLTASWHDEGNQSRETFNDKVSWLRQQGVQSCINIVMIPQNWDKLLADAEYFYQHGNRIALRRQDLGDGQGPVGYSQEQLALLTTAFPSPARSPETMRIARPLDYELHHDDGAVTTMPVTSVPTAGNNKFQGWRCHAGYQMVSVLANGVVRRGMMCRDRPLGTLSGGFQLFPQPAPCITPICHNTFDLRACKHK